MNLNKATKILALSVIVTAYAIVLTPVRAESGSSSATMSLNVPVQTVVTCASPPVTASPGTNTLTVTCSLTGNPNNLTSGTANSFGPSNVNLTNGSGSTLQASLNSSVTSPDGTVSGISGGSTGFSGTINSLPAKVQASYNVTTTSSTKSGAYTGTTTYTWSTI
jgi:hypothetical protein